MGNDASTRDEYLGVGFNTHRHLKTGALRVVWSTQAYTISSDARLSQFAIVTSDSGFANFDTCSQFAIVTADFQFTNFDTCSQFAIVTADSGFAKAGA